MKTIEDLHSEIIQKILSYLDPEDIYNASQTCKKLRKMCRIPSILKIKEIKKTFNDPKSTQYFRDNCEFGNLRYLTITLDIKTRTDIIHVMGCSNCLDTKLINENMRWTIDFSCLAKLKRLKLCVPDQNKALFKFYLPEYLHRLDLLNGNSFIYFKGCKFLDILNIGSLTTDVKLRNVLFDLSLERPITTTTIAMKKFCETDLLTIFCWKNLFVLELICNGIFESLDLSSIVSQIMSQRDTFNFKELFACLKSEEGNVSKHKFESCWTYSPDYDDGHERQDGGIRIDGITCCQNRDPLLFLNTTRSTDLIH